MGREVGVRGQTPTERTVHGIVDESVWIPLGMLEFLVRGLMQGRRRMVVVGRRMVGGMPDAEVRHSLAEVRCRERVDVVAVSNAAVASVEGRVGRKRVVVGSEEAEIDLSFVQR